MKKTILGIVLAAFAVFLWGFLYWGISTLPYSALKQASQGDVLAGQALLQHFPENGAYVVPGMQNTKETMAQLYEQGPVAMVYMVASNGKQMEDPAMMMQGLLLYIFMASMLAWIFHLTGSALPRYSERVKLSALIGAMVAVTIHIGETIWWSSPFMWKFYAAVYDTLTWTIAGAVLAKFISSDKAKA